MKFSKLLSTSVLTLSLILAGCENSETVQTEQNETEKLTIYTTIYPLENFTKKIGGDYVDVKSIYPPNVDAHSFEPSPKDMIALAESDLFIHTGVGIDGFAEKAAESLEKESVTILEAGKGIELLESSHNEEHHHEAESTEAEEHDHEGESVEAEGTEAKAGDHEHEGESTEAEGHEHEEENLNHGNYDPHVWLDPIRSIELAKNIKNTLSELEPEHASEFESNFIQLKDELEKLDQEFKTTIENSKTNYLLVAHEAYGYWEERYGIEQIAIAGLSPTQEPSQKELQHIIEESTEHNIHYVIFEQSVSPKVAKIIQEELGAESLTLHNLESITEENIKQKDDYFSIMRMNLQTIKTALND
ncbi:ABC transporter substrate-binding protein [Peribacillus saganii]|uniref:ABC transporter substrate-binding protein n=1 Tax=Peribacillus saganii TaxID=2303992 RepID=A0A372LQW2_9BACI|nr:zinc ABC transporter substrate-binding protein [Peribacillus saganii]RFU70591.1 ABC transporter substrate-binding protein [Peribacillus saganii]